MQVINSGRDSGGQLTRQHGNYGSANCTPSHRFVPHFAGRQFLGFLLGSKRSRLHLPSRLSPTPSRSFSIVCHASGWQCGFSGLRESTRVQPFLLLCDFLSDLRISRRESVSSRPLCPLFVEGWQHRARRRSVHFALRVRRASYLEMVHLSALFHVPRPSVKDRSKTRRRIWLWTSTTIVNVANRKENEKMSAMNVYVRWVKILLSILYTFMHWFTTR